MSDLTSELFGVDNLKLLLNIYRYFFDTEVS